MRPGQLQSSVKGGLGLNLHQCVQGSSVDDQGDGEGDFSKAVGSPRIPKQSQKAKQITTLQKASDQLNPKANITMAEQGVSPASRKDS